MSWLLLHAVLDLLGPETCAVCGVGRAHAAWYEGPRVRARGLRPWDAPHLCRGCHERARNEVHEGRVEAWPLLAAQPTAPWLVRAVGQWKYHGLRGLAWPLADVLDRAMETAVERHGGEILVPVPLHRGRRRARGFDHVVLLAALASRASGVPARTGILRRHRATRQQAGQATSGEARRRNVAAAFACEPATRESAPVILLDDLATTGATLAAAAEALTDAGWTVTCCLAIGLAARLASAGGDLDSGSQPGQVVAESDGRGPVGDEFTRRPCPLEEP
jgi:ComF family protein